MMANEDTRETSNVNSEKELNILVKTLRWKHKLLDPFVRNANLPEILPHIAKLRKEMDELELMLHEPVEESISKLIEEIRNDCSMIEIAMPSSFRATDSSNTASNLSSSKANSNVRLPKLNINTFDGCELAWLSWWDQFESTIHNNPELNDNTRVQYLATALIGNAKESTSQFPFVTASYQNIIDYLKTTYGNVVKLRSIYANAITNMSSDNSIEGMRKNLDNLKAYLNHLKSFDTNQTIDHYLALVLSKFPDDIRMAAYMYLDIKDEEDNLQNILFALDRVIKYKEKIQSLLRTVEQPTTETDRPNVVMLTSTSGVKRKQVVKSCVFCSKTHSSKNCRTYMQADKHREILTEKSYHLCI